MATAIRMPDIGTNVEECKLLAWRVREEERVKRGGACRDRDRQGGCRTRDNGRGCAFAARPASAQRVPKIVESAPVKQAVKQIITPASNQRLSSLATDLSVTRIRTNLMSLSFGIVSKYDRSASTT